MKNYIFAAIVIALVIAGVILVWPAKSQACFGYPHYSYDCPPYPPAPQPVVQQPIYIPQPVPVPVQVPVYVPVPVYPPLTVSCYANATQIYPGQMVTWTANVQGGDGNYSYSWSGNDGLYGSSQSNRMTYLNPGQKYAAVTVYSAGKNVTQQCGNPVNVTQPVVYQPVYTPVYNPVYVQPSLPSLDVGCFADPTSAKINQPVNWTAEVTGGIGPYRYSWSGTDNVTGNQSSIIKYYFSAGEKYAVVTVTSADGRSATKACSNSVVVKSATKAVAKPVAKPAVTQNCCVTQVCCTQNSSGQPVTYQYQAPTNGGYTNGTTYQVPTQNGSQTQAPVVELEPKDTNSDQVAASFFPLANVPWGWVAILVIALLFFTVLYLLLNRQKI